MASGVVQADTKEEGMSFQGHGWRHRPLLASPVRLPPELLKPQFQCYYHTTASTLTVERLAVGQHVIIYVNYEFVKHKTKCWHRDVVYRRNELGLQNKWKEKRKKKY